MSDIFKYELPCDNCGTDFNRQELTRYRNHLYCNQCLQKIRNDGRGKVREGGKKPKPPFNEGVIDDLKETRKQLGLLEGKLNELEGTISGITANATSAAQEIAKTLKDIAEDLKIMLEKPQTLQTLNRETKLPERTSNEKQQQEIPPLPPREFQIPSDIEVRAVFHTPAIINWGAIIELAIKCGWHRSYHTFLAFLRVIDKHHRAILVEAYRGKPISSELDSKRTGQTASLYSAWVSSVANHVTLLHTKNLRWTDFLVPVGTGEIRNAHSRWQQAILDYLIDHQNTPTSSREIADALLPKFDSTSTLPVRRRMLQNVVATLVRRGILALKTPATYPKLFWIPDCRR